MKAVIMTFFLAMSINPQIQKRLHDELDAVVGRDRLPTLQDRAELPFLTAVYQECLRWLPGVPTGPSSLLFVLRSTRLMLYTTGIPHQSSQDDIYDGYFIPKGSVVMVNMWFVKSIFPAVSSHSSLGNYFMILMSILIQ